ncbi:MAG: ribonuclease J, partial [Lachnospiraceae bacterium]|nr:ribonuclease J [Lachnospiraceae bacterium]
MNITAFEYAESIIVVDCGLAFPTDEMPGIDLVVPDVTYLLENRDKVRAFFITHGHEDHIGGLPYVLKQLNVPVYAARLTAAVIETKLEEHDMLDSVRLNVMAAGDVVSVGDFKVEFIHVNHSITDAVAFAITSPAGTVIMTGDFKIDYTPLSGAPADLQRFGELGRQGVLALLSDSTNALRPGFTPSEQTVAEFFDDAFRTYKDHRIMVATFASNLDRVQQIITNAAAYGR